MNIFEVTEDEVKKAFDGLDNKSSAGDDGVSNLIAKATSEIVVPVLTRLIQKSFKSGVFPDVLKHAKVLPLHKDGSKSDENNCRPISLLNVWSKIFERLMFNRVYFYMEHFSLIYQKQFGFRKKHSTIDALIELMENVRRFGAKNTSSFFIDLKKAFDTIDHPILLFKLEKYGIRGQALHWFTSYLSNRKQRVEVNGSSSNWKRIVCGVPQGSILGPLLFLIYINDLPSSCQNLDIPLFADDTNLTAINCSNEDIDRDLESLSNWLEANKLLLNLEKLFK